MQLYVARAGKELGSFWMDEVREKLKSGEFKPTDHGWMEGRGDWKLLTEFPELASAIPEPAKPAAEPPPQSAEPAPKIPAAETLAEQPVKSHRNSGRSKKGTSSQSVGTQTAESNEQPQTLMEAAKPEPQAATPESSLEHPVRIPVASAPAPEADPAPSATGIVTAPITETASGSPGPAEDTLPEIRAETLAPAASAPVASVTERSAEPHAEKLSPVEPEAALHTAISSSPYRAELRPVDDTAETETPMAQPPVSTPPTADEPEPEQEVERIFLPARPVEPEEHPHSPHPVVVPGPVPTSKTAIASVVFGILSLTVLPFVGAICALIFGHLARRRIAEARGALDGSSIARTGLTLGYWGFFLSLFAIVGGLVWMISARPSPRNVVAASLSNAREIAIACQAYAVDHQGAYPETLTELTPKYLPNPATLTCPFSGSSVPIGYEYYGGRDNDPPSNILLVSKARQRNRRVVAYVDATVKVVFNMPDLPPHER